MANIKPFCLSVSIAFLRGCFSLAITFALRLLLPCCSPMWPHRCVHNTWIKKYHSFKEFLSHDCCWKEKNHTSHATVFFNCSQNITGNIGPAFSDSIKKHSKEWVSVTWLLAMKVAPCFLLQGWSGRTSFSLPVCWSNSIDIRRITLNLFWWEMKRLLVFYLRWVAGTITKILYVLEEKNMVCTSRMSYTTQLV